MMKKIILWSIVMLVMSGGAMAQNDWDAFRFSQVNWSGTARFMGAGGAFGAIGGDYSSLATNPAGIGLFKRAEISFTPVVIQAINTNATYNGEISYEGNVCYSITNFGAIFSWQPEQNKPEEQRKWRMIQFGVGYNRINDFNNIHSSTGMNGGVSMIDGFVEAANHISPDNLTRDGLLAWNSWLIDIDTASDTENQYYNFIGHDDMRQQNLTKVTGGIDEMDFSCGGNYNDQLYIGFTLGIPFLDYHSQISYSEEDVNDSVVGYYGFSSCEDLHTTGVGINAKFGLIYQPVSFLRIGAAIHTPTYYDDLKENYSREIISEFEDETLKDSYENLSKYKITTPFRIMGSLGFLIAKRAFISAEYEFADYSMAHLFSSDNIKYHYDFHRENAAIQEKYGACHTVRVGGELTVTENFLLRLGYSFSSSPYKNRINTGLTHNISGGIGFRSKIFFCDFAYICRLTGENSWYFEDDFLNPVKVNSVNHKFAATFGIKF